MWVNPWVCPFKESLPTVSFSGICSYLIVTFVRLCCYLRRRRRLCFWFGLFVCLSVGLSVYLFVRRITRKLVNGFWRNFWRGRAWLKDQVIQFWWQSGSRFGSGSPKSEIWILRIGGGLCSLSISFLLCISCFLAWWWRWWCYWQFQLFFQCIAIDAWWQWLCAIINIKSLSHCEYFSVQYYNVLYIIS